MSSVASTPASKLLLTAPVVQEQKWRAVKSLLRSQSALVALIIVFIITGLAIFAPQVAPRDPARVDVLKKNVAPAFLGGEYPEHWLGADKLGRDVWARLVYGARVSLSIGLAVVVVGGIVGTLLGLLSGYYGGWIDDVIMRLAEIQLAFPFLLLAISLLVVLGRGLFNLILVLSISSWVTYARVVRGQVIAVREKEFIEAARSIGQRDTAILLRHLLPNVFAPVIIIASFSVASTIIAEAGLSYLGLGVPATVPTWGGMLQDGREYMQEAWWGVTLPGLAIMVTVLSINILGDWLRDYLDPRLRL